MIEITKKCQYRNYSWNIITLGLYYLIKNILSKDMDKALDVLIGTEHNVEIILDELVAGYLIYGHCSRLNIKLFFWNIQIFYQNI